MSRFSPRITLGAVLLIVVAGNGSYGVAAELEDTAAAAPAKTADPTLVDRTALENLPVREITIFKDGHAFVLHEAMMSPDNNGRVYLDNLPTPVIGTFWPYAIGDGVKLESVVAARRAVRSRKTALSIRELLEANQGARVRIQPESGTSYAAKVVAIPSRKNDKRASQNSSDSAAAVQPGDIAILKTDEGYRTVPLSSIREVVFLDEPQMQTELEEQEQVLSLQLSRAGDTPAPTAKVGMIYLQKGIRWIPNYKVELDGNGTAKVRLQATLINELADLEGVDANLVIGVPHFTFKETIDPIALGRTTAQLSTYFQQNSQTALAFSNAIQTQVSRMGEHRGGQLGAPESANLGPEIAGSGKQEDLYVFTVRGISLNKGERMVVPVVEFEIPYEDVYTLRIGMLPPPELHQHFNSDQQRELAQLQLAPKAIHQVRLTNRSPYPLTTAPALIMRDARLIGQAMMTYTSTGGRVDVELTTAVDIQVKKSDEETKRTPNAANWGGNVYDRVDLSGKIELFNYKNTPVELEVQRFVLGNVAEAGSNGKATRLNVREEGWPLIDGYPHWWSWYSWPGGWFSLNGIGRVNWQVTVDAGQGTALSYQWHYFWRR